MSGLFSMDAWATVWNHRESFLLGLGNTLMTAFFALALAFVLGVVLGLMATSGKKPLQFIARVYVEFIQNTPLLLQLFFFYYFFPLVLDIKGMNVFVTVLLTFVLNYAAYFAEIFRGGIQSIDRGQYEGAKVLGMTYVQTMRRIILPQVVKRVLPPVSNETINLLKDTSLVYILAMNDILRITRSIVQRDFDTTAFLVAAVFYLFFTFILTKVFGYLEKRYAVYDE